MPTHVRWPAAPVCWRSRRAATRCSWPGRAARICGSSRSRSPEAPRARCSALTRRRACFPVAARLSASAPRAALILEMGPGPGQPEAVQTFAGPLAGGWVALQPFTGTGRPGAVRPQRVQADGDRIFTTESQREDTRVAVRDPAPHQVAFAEGEDDYLARFAGESWPRSCTARRSGAGLSS